MNIKLFFMFITITMMFTFCTSSNKSEIEKLSTETEIELESIQVNTSNSVDSLNQPIVNNSLSDLKGGPLLNLEKSDRIKTAKDSVGQPYFKKSPFSPTSKLYFNIVKSDSVNIEVFDNLGNPATKPFNEKIDIGSYYINFDKVDFKSGVYLIRFKSGDNEFVKKVIFIK